MSRRDSKDFQNLYEVTETLNDESQPSEPRSGTSHQKSKINLLNFDPNSKVTHFLNSPLSIEACKVLGIEEWELLTKTKRDFRYENIPSKFKQYKEEFLELKAEYYEKCRLERLQNCIEARQKLYAKVSSKNQIKDLTANAFSYRSYKDDGNLSLIMSPKKILETGKKHLSATKRKQDQEIELIMETEKMRERLDVRLEDHMQRVTEIRESKKIEFERREKEAQAEKMKRENRKMEIEKERERSLRRRLNYSYVEDRENKGDMSLLDNSLIIQSARGHSRDLSRSKLFTTSESIKKRSASIQEAEETRKLFGEQRYNDKMRKFEEQKKKLDLQKKLVLENRRTSFEAKQEEMHKIKSARERQTSLEREKKYNEKLEIVQRNKQRITEAKELERREKSLKENKHAEEVRHKVKQVERELDLRNQNMFEELGADLSRAENQRKEVLSERRFVHIMNYLKEEEAKINMRRKEKMQKYHEKKLGERIETHSNRVESRSREREKLSKENASVVKELSQERAELKEEFAQLKKQLDKDHFNKYYGSPSQLSTFRSTISYRSESSSRYPKSRPRSPEQKNSARDKRDTIPCLLDSGFSTPNKKINSHSHHHTRSGSKSLASTSRRFQEEQNSGIFGDTSYDTKEKKTQQESDDEATLFAGKAFGVKSAKKIGMEELIRTLDREIQAQLKGSSTFKRSADAIMDIVKLHNEYTENLMQETDYLELPWKSFNSMKP